MVGGVLRRNMTWDRQEQLLEHVVRDSDYRRSSVHYNSGMFTD